MRLTHLGRTVAGLAVLAVTSSALAMPASAQDAPTIGKAALEAFAAKYAPGQYTAADLELEPNIDDIEELADLACAPEGYTPSSDLILLNLVESGVGPTAILVSADISVDDDPSNREVTCTFGVLLTKTGTTFDGSYSFTVGSGVDANETLTGPVSGNGVSFGPVYTDIEYYANATFSASGSQLNPAQRVVSSPVSTAKTPSQKKAAKKSYAKKVKAAKKAYKKAGKSKKAKKAYNKKLKAYKTAYKKAIAPTSTTVNQLQNYIAPTPYTLNALLNSSHQV